MDVYNIHMDVENIQFTQIEIRVLKFIFKHFKERYNARQIARILSINHAHANKLCNSLTKKDLLLKEGIGNSVYYSFNYDNELALKFMEYLLSLEEKEFPKWLRIVAHSLKKFKDCIEMGLVFGSSIKNKDFDDIDILLIYDIEMSKKIKKIKDEIRKSELIEKPIRYMDITKNDILLNKEN